jgi:hypothetical protein
MSLLRILVVVSLLASSSPALATVTTEWAGMQFTGSGFLTASIAKMLDGSVKGVNDVGYNCPCQVVNFSQGAVYQAGQLDFSSNTKLGLQGSVAVNDKLSLTSQVMFRGALNGQPNLEWAYGSYKITDTTTLQIGRKRLPLFYYSETQDVGFTHPYGNLPQQTYGWSIVNYNGANLMHKAMFGSWSATANVFIGYETALNNPINPLYSGVGVRGDDHFDDIAGAELFLSKGWFEGRLAYIQFNSQDRYPDQTPESWDWSGKQRQRVYGFSTMMTPGNWVINTEFYTWTHFMDNHVFMGGSGAVGYRIGDWLPMISYSVFDDYAHNDSLLEGEALDSERYNTLSLILRYDINHWSDVKVQYNNWDDNSGPTHKMRYGDSQTISLSYDMVF